LHHTFARITPQKATRPLKRHIEQTKEAEAVPFVPQTESMSACGDILPSVGSIPWAAQVCSFEQTPVDDSRENLRNCWMDGDRFASHKCIMLINA